MTRKCRIYREEEAEHIWQPWLDADSFIRPGFHYRGFAAIPVSEKARLDIKAGKPIEFKYKKHHFRFENGEISEVIETIE